MTALAAGAVMMGVGISVFLALVVGNIASDREPSYEDHRLVQFALVLSMAVMGVGAALMAWG